MLLSWLLACHPDDPALGPVATDFALTVDPRMGLMVHASWTEPARTGDRWVELRLDGGDWATAPAIGPGEAVLLGIPAETAVEARPGFVLDGQTVYGPTATATTAALPEEVLVPTVVAYDPALADPARYGMIVMASGGGTFAGPFVISIFDRDGRVVWYQVLPADVMSFYAAPARDGTHLWFEQEQIFVPGETPTGITRQTLDGRWSASWPVEDLGQAVAEGADGAFLVERRGDEVHALDLLDASGAITRIWDCGAAFEALGLGPGQCLMNTCNYDPVRNTALVSQFRTGTVFEIDVATGEVVRQMGQLAVGEPYAFDPPESNFAYQHDARWTDAGTLMVTTHEPCDGTDPARASTGRWGSTDRRSPLDSSRMPRRSGEPFRSSTHQDDCDPVRGKRGIQLASEYEVDDATRTLTRVWSYRSTDRWATQWGEAYPVPNGNVIQGYGQDGAVREVTRDGEVAWEAEWPAGSAGYRLIGHFSLIDDLYALNAGS